MMKQKKKGVSLMGFSPEQLEAINHEGENILVSAGAGSGKTAVLSERIYRLVEKGNPISSFLVLTSYGSN